MAKNWRSFLLLCFVRRTKFFARLIMPYEIQLCKYDLVSFKDNVAILIQGFCRGVQHAIFCCVFPLQKASNDVLYSQIAIVFQWWRLILGLAVVTHAVIRKKANG
ncbi:MAG: hypothetical protein EZS28_026103, partial [Streblomastix strix]